MQLDGPKMPVIAEVSLEEAQDNTQKDIFVGLILSEYHAFQNAVSSNTARNIEFNVTKPGQYHAVAYTVVGIDDDGRARHSVAHGQVKVIGDYERGEFKAKLRAE